MMEEEKSQTSHSWWFDSHNNNNTKRSPWLQSTIYELERKTQAMLKVIKEDADSFAKRAEMYYKKRPELINMVEDFYRSHRSLAERYDLVKSGAGKTLALPCTKSQLDTSSNLISPRETHMSSYTKSQLERSTSEQETSYDSYSDAYELKEAEESEVDDPEPEEEEEEEEEVVEFSVQIGMRKGEASISSVVDEVTKLKEEIERLKLENGIQMEQLVEKDEEKREVIRQLSQAMDMLREENLNLREISKKATTTKNQKSMEFNLLKEGFW